MKQQKFEFLLKKIDYPFSDELLLNSEQRLKFIEYLMRLHSETLFQYFSIDHSDLNSRIKSIKCQLLTTGIWGQSKHGKNVDINKLIQGICSYEQSLSFIYKLAKCVYNNQRNIETNTNLLNDCLLIPHQLINSGYDPFIQTLPKEQEFIDNTNLNQLNQEINDILELQEQDLNKLQERLDKNDIVNELGNINEKQKIIYINNLKMLNNKIKQMNQHHSVLEQIEQQNTINDDPRYTITFPSDYIQIIQDLNTIKNAIQSTTNIPSIVQTCQQTNQLIDQDLYFIQ